MFLVWALHSDIQWMIQHWILDPYFHRSLLIITWSEYGRCPTLIHPKEWNLTVRRRGVQTITSLIQSYDSKFKVCSKINDKPFLHKYKNQQSKNHCIIPRLLAIKKQYIYNTHIEWLKSLKYEKFSFQITFDNKHPVDSQIARIIASNGIIYVHIKHQIKQNKNKS